MIHASWGLSIEVHLWCILTHGLYLRHMVWSTSWLYIDDVMVMPFVSYWGIGICMRHIFSAWCEAYSWYMYEMHVLVILIHVEIYLSNVMVHWLVSHLGYIGILVLWLSWLCLRHFIDDILWNTWYCTWYGTRLMHETILGFCTWYGTS